MGRNRKAPRERRLEVVSARVELNFYKEVQELSKKTDLTMAHIARLALREYLDRHREPQKEAAA